MFGKANNIHFVGIGGSGMSGIAEVLINLGYNVTGSDIAASEVTEHLESCGVKVNIGHSAINVSGTDVVVTSTAVGKDNVEVFCAREKHIPVIPRAEMLSELMRLKYGIAIAGTHGKTTTTSIVATILGHAKLDPTVVIGGRLNSLKTGAKLGESELMVAEADESDGSFLKLSPTIAVVTSLDKEHMDFYKSLKNLTGSFLSFINKVPFYGTSILCLDEPYIQALIPKIEKRYITYGFTNQADFTAKSIKTKGLQTSFSVYMRNNNLGTVTINMPGEHNVLNSLASIIVGLELDVEFEVIRQGLKKFSGVERRFQIIGEKNEITIVDDYGHHPAEILTTLKSARCVWEKNKIYVIFQPHRYSRTKSLMEDFFTVFYDADSLIISDIYAAGEDPIVGVSSEVIYEGVKNHGHKDVTYMKNKGEIVDHLSGILKKDDIVITLGAGDIWRTARELLNRL